jgi:manganese transport protein
MNAMAAAVSVAPGRRRAAIRSVVGLAGPAFIAAIAYVDPGNVATNIAAGSRYGYLLLWVVILANAMAMLVQYLSAKLGIATGRNLPELCRDRYRRSVRLGLWVQAELVIVMTDLAEIVGGAIAVHLLFGLPLLAGGVVTGVALLIVLSLQVRGHQGFQPVVIGLLGVVALGFVYQALRLPGGATGFASGMVPRFAGGDSVLLAAGIVGATVMPHAIYLHSALTQRLPAESSGLEEQPSRESRRRALRVTRWDVLVAMSIAGLVNVAIIAVGTSVSAQAGTTLDSAHAAFAAQSGWLAGAVFAVALLASGFASASVGVYAGQVVMQGFIQRQIPLSLRRVVSMLPPLALLGLGMNPTLALVLSQVVLSFGIPLALVPLVMLTRRRDVMGVHVNRRPTTIVAWSCVLLISGLNVFLLYQQFFM